MNTFNESTSIIDQNHTDRPPSHMYYTTNYRDQTSNMRLADQCSNQIQSKPPPLNTLLYLNDFRSRYLGRQKNRSLGAHIRESETQASYKTDGSVSELCRPSAFGLSIPCNNQENMSEVVLKSSQLAEMGDRDSYREEMGVISRLNPYKSTYQTQYRSWSDNEMSETDDLWIPTFWDHGKRSEMSMLEITNSIRDDNMPTKLELPMIDRETFKSRTRQIRIQPLIRNVPHMGLKTVYQSDYGKAHGIPIILGNISQSLESGCAAEIRRSDYQKDQCDTNKAQKEEPLNGES